MASLDIETYYAYQQKEGILPRSQIQQAVDHNVL